MSVDEKEGQTKTFWNTYQPKMWNFLENPDSSTVAKLYGYVTLFFVMLSIFSFVADTTSEFATYKKSPSNDVTTYSVLNSSTEINNTTIGTTSFTRSSESITESTPSLDAIVRVKHPYMHIIDIICLVFFTIEYITRLVFVPRKLKFVTSTMGVIDLIAILPDFIALILFSARPDMMFNSGALETVSFFRILRVLRIFRLVRHVPGLWVLVYTLRASVGELILLSCFMLVGILVFSSLIYFADERDNFESIPHAFWWAIITMTTVGYGDMYPTTTLGKLVGSLCAMSGLLMIGFSVPTLVNNFTLYYKHMQFALQAEKRETSDHEEPSDKHHWHHADDDKNEHARVPQTDNNDNKTEDVPLMTVSTSVDNKTGKGIELF